MCVCVCAPGALHGCGGGLLGDLGLHVGQHAEQALLLHLTAHDEAQVVRAVVAAVVGAH